jgi:uncharacterized protein (TIGR02246 family)
MRMFCVFFSVSVLLGVAATKGTPEDERAIRQVIADRMAAFNRHEAKLNPAGFSDDFDVVLPNGSYIVGKPDLGDRFSTVLSNARLIETVDRIRFIRPEVALVDGKFEFIGTEMKPDPKGLECLVLVKENGRWVIAALRQMILTAMPGTTPPGR